MSNHINSLNIFEKIKKKLELCKYFSPSYFYYMIMELNKEKYDNIKNKKKESKEAKKNSEESSKLKSLVSEVMKYFFYFIDLVIIFTILIKNIISRFETNMIFDGIIYIFITSIVFYFTVYCVTVVRSLVKEEGIIEKIINFNEYDKKDGELWSISTKKYVKRKMVKLALSKTVYILGIIIFIMGIITLINKKIGIYVSAIAIYYFIMRPVHYCVVFYKDFKNKVSSRFVESADKKMRYIKLALFNYVKIVLEFSILIYILKYMGWAFTKINVNTFFELVHFIVAGKLEATTTIEIFINLLRISTLAMVITLNLATYMSLEVRNTDNNITT